MRHWLIFEGEKERVLPGTEVHHLSLVIECYFHVDVSLQLSKVTILFACFFFFTLRDHYICLDEFFSSWMALSYDFIRDLSLVAFASFDMQVSLQHLDYWSFRQYQFLKISDFVFFFFILWMFATVIRKSSLLLLSFVPFLGYIRRFTELVQTSLKILIFSTLLTLDRKS